MQHWKPAPGDGNISRSEVDNSSGSYLGNSWTLALDGLCSAYLGTAAGRAVQLGSSVWCDLVQSSAPWRNCRWSNRSEKSGHGPHDVVLCFRLVFDNAVFFPLADVAGDERELVPQNSGRVGIVVRVILEILDRVDAVRRGLLLVADARIAKNLARSSS